MLRDPRRLRPSDAGAKPESAKLSELLQKPQIVRPELADIVDVVVEHGDAFGAHAEGEAGVDGRVVAAVVQHHRVYHARAGDLQPAGALREPIGVWIVLWPVDVYLDRRLGER